MKGLITFLVVAALLTGGWFVWHNFIYPNIVAPDFPPEPSTVTIGDTVVRAEVANTAEKTKKGLGGRESLPENEGMLFVFLDANYHGFWMKDMNFPIDIIWIGPDRQIVDITKNVSPDTYPEVFQPAEPAQYVLEVNAGFADRHNISVGDEAQLNIKL